MTDSNMAIEIRQLELDEVLTLFTDEHLAHAAEVRSSTFQLDYNPNFDTYEALYLDGSFVPLAAFVNGEFAGYLNIIANPSMIDKDSFVAIADGFYVSPKYRRAGVMQALVAHAEQLCKSSGIHSLSLSVMHGLGGGEEFVSSLGYTPAEVTFTKIL